MQLVPFVQYAIEDLPRRVGQTIVDFVRISESRSISGVYEGICW